jgi:hypothetical protein
VFIDVYLWFNFCVASLSFNPGNFVGREEIELRGRDGVCLDMASSELGPPGKAQSMMGSHESSGATSLIDPTTGSLRSRAGPREKSS